MSMFAFPLAFMNEKAAPQRNCFDRWPLQENRTVVSNLIQTRRDVGLRLTNTGHYPQAPQPPGVPEDPTDLSLVSVCPSVM
jgi:hypothetical protein